MLLVEYLLLWGPVDFVRVFSHPVLAEHGDFMPVVVCERHLAQAGSCFRHLFFSSIEDAVSVGERDYLDRLMCVSHHGD